MGWYQEQKGEKKFQQGMTSKQDTWLVQVGMQSISFINNLLTIQSPSQGMHRSIKHALI